jgi:SPW repeat-containing protein
MATPGESAGRGPPLLLCHRQGDSFVLVLPLPQESETQSAGSPVRYGRAVLAGKWWFWVLAGALVGVAAVGSAHYRALAARARRLALERRLVDAGPAHRIDTRPSGFWSDLTWMSLLLGAWVIASPWIWGYDDVPGAVTTDVVTGAAVVVLTIAGIAFPALNALMVLAGLWLVLAPWTVGYGDEGGPVGLSDAVAGAMIAALGVASLAAAAKRIAPGGTMPVGRVRRGPDA